MDCLMFLLLLCQHLDNHLHVENMLYQLKSYITKVLTKVSITTAIEINPFITPSIFTSRYLLAIKKCKLKQNSILDPLLIV